MRAIDLLGAPSPHQRRKAPERRKPRPACAGRGPATFQSKVDPWTVTPCGGGPSCGSPSSRSPSCGPYGPSSFELPLLGYPPSRELERRDPTFPKVPRRERLLFPNTDRGPRATVAAHRNTSVSDSSRHNAKKNKMMRDHVADA